MLRGARRRRRRWRERVVRIWTMRWRRRSERRTISFSSAATRNAKVFAVVVAVVAVVISDVAEATTKGVRGKRRRKRVLICKEERMK